VKTYIVATVGTSLLSSMRRELQLAPEALPHKAAALDFLGSRAATDRACGAEVNSLAHLLAGQKLTSGSVEPPVEVTLLVSDTEEGEWTGSVLGSYLSRRPDVERAGALAIQGLRGDSPSTFAQEGLRNLVRLAAQCLTDAEKRSPGALRLLDTTGGYKAQVAFAGLIGQVLRVPVVYLFEQFPRCIELPPLPVDFDRSLWIEHYGLFRLLSEEGYLAVQDVELSEVDPRIRDLLDRERIDGVEYLALSPMLELMHQGFWHTEPVGLEEPPPTEVPYGKKLHLVEKELPHAPKGTLEQCERLALLPWVERVKNGVYLNTRERWRVRPGGTDDISQIVCVYGDGSNKGNEIVLWTTARTNPQRQWCLDRLKDGV